MTIKFLKAEHGDAIFISYINDGEIKNILIDTGTGAIYSSRGNGRRKEGDLKKLVQSLKENNQKIDLLIITHWDDDHIGGVLKWFKEDIEGAKNLIKQIWFNSGTLINQYFVSNKASEDKNILYMEYNPNTSVRQGITFEKYILDNDLSHSLIKIDTKLDDHINGAKFTILSPTDTELRKLLTKWEESPYNPNTSASKKDYDKTFAELLSNDFQEDNAIHNGSSIAFILEIENSKMLFLGDAHPSVIIDNLRKLEYSKDNKLQLDFVKISHHGSKANTSNELLDMIESKKFVISSDGSSHGNPNKETIARIVNKNEGCTIYFNYPHLIDKIFTQEELNSGKFKVMGIGEINI
ncbi:ComEC/Rec2 family competence protein [Sulfurovum sp. TSL1]|uniref:ComEC/Rec2 family competence protein n=1 Tax=Sulfurovum sp. TSL1 TaxID=2826994 RepID=UPI001CC3B430|nr:MBL fold metallo-hydrolase [Sulfurovum sp. TSL1]GIT97995.1 MBL fold hydrolase [Sulfurovum sp. TSL1]